MISWLHELAQNIVAHMAKEFLYLMVDKKQKKRQRGAQEKI
jgi:hypothetical protein